jgi:hypothetical protein
LISFVHEMKRGTLSASLITYPPGEFGSIRRSLLFNTPVFKRNFTRSAILLLVAMELIAMIVFDS